MGNGNIHILNPGEGQVCSQRPGCLMKRTHASLEYQMRHVAMDDGISSLDQKYFQNYLPLGASALPVNEVKSENIHKSLLILTFQTSIKTPFHMVA